MASRFFGRKVNVEQKVIWQLLLVTYRNWGMRWENWQRQFYQRRWIKCGQKFSILLQNVSFNAFEINYLCSIFVNCLRNWPQFVRWANRKTRNHVAFNRLQKKNGLIAMMSSLEMGGKKRKVNEKKTTNFVQAV